MSWAIRNLWFLIAFLANFLTMLLMYWESFATKSISLVWSIDSALTATIILAPVCAGLAAIRSWTLRTRSEIIESFPNSGRIRAYLQEPIKISFGAIFATLLITMIISLIGVANGLELSRVALAPVPLTLLHLVGTIFFGAGLGYLLPHPLTGPVFAVCYMAMSSLQIGSISALNSYIGASIEWVGQMEYSSSGLIFLLCTFIFLAISGLITLCGYAFDKKFVTIIGVIIALLSFGSLPFQNQIQMWKDRPNAFNYCADISTTGVKICVPKEQHKRLKPGVSKIQPIVEKLAKLDSEISGTVIKIPYLLSLKDIKGPEPLDPETSIFNLLGHFTCLESLPEEKLFAISDDKIQEISAARETVAHWINNDATEQEASKAFQAMNNLCG
ncbi:MAG: hypothetical protein SPG61_03270 [Arcanobacterium sp.]|nr:hypothetical protein [Arcanobacterium sp.]